MKLLLSIMSALSVLGCTIPKQPRIETFVLRSELFNNERCIRVFLPREYDGERSFPVLYLNDGQNLFGDHERVGVKEWRIDEIVDSLMLENKIDPLIIVGIDNAGKNRSVEYLPWPDTYLTPPLSNPEGAKYPDFLIQEVMPAVEKRYPVLTGREHTGVGGASYGGLIALYTVLEKPGFFGFMLLESPSLYVQKQQILSLSRDFGGPWPNRIFLGIGTNELGLSDCLKMHEDNVAAVKDVQTLNQIIQAQSSQGEVRMVIDSCAVHGEEAWSDRFPSAIQFLVASD